MAGNTLIASNKLRSSKERLITRTSWHALVSQTHFFEATPTMSFQGVRISSVASCWSCSKTDKSNCCSCETLFDAATCGFKRRDAVNYAKISGVGKSPPPPYCCKPFGSCSHQLIVAIFCFLESHVHASGFSGTNFQFLSIHHNPLDHTCPCIAVF